MDDIILENTPQKQCPKCTKFFPATTEFFHRCKTRIDGLHYYCKVCRIQKKIVEPRLDKYCPSCKMWFPATTEFFHRTNRSSRDGLRTPCKSCRHKKEVVEDVALHPDKYKKKYQKHLAKPPEEREEMRVRNIQNLRILRATKRRPGMCTSCYIRPVQEGQRCDVCKSYTNQWVKDNFEDLKVKWKQERDRLRKQVIDAYGGKCIECEETCIGFLAIDHINNDGANHRQQVGNNIYRWLRRNGFPQENFQVLCHNCNWKKYALHFSTKRDSQKIWYETLRNDILVAYGGKCKCCGETQPEVLAVDHINGGGNKHRRIVGLGKNFYSWLRKKGFPQDDFQLLCHNCNMAKSFYGICPHQNISPLE